MISISRARQLIDCGLSLIPIGDNKVPWIKWKQYHTEQISKDELERLMNDDRTKGIGIVTGYNDLEVIDVDLKILPSLKDQQDFWNELYSFLSDNIDSFDEKFVIYKTINNGYHILYRCKTIEGNKKLAKLSGYKEAIIETRGKGGYVFVYENQISTNDYTQIKEISELDRQVLMEICTSYNTETEEIKVTEKLNKEYQSGDISPWTDYNQKTSILDVIGDDFQIIRTLSDKYIIKRHGAKSAHSGYVFKDSGCMYLFSTGTIFPAEKLISPFVAYAFKNHSGDMRAAASELYRKGFGSRIVKEPKEIREKPKYNLNDALFPIDIFPDKLQNYIVKCNKTLNSSIDYMGCSLLWLTSVCIGNSLQIRVKNGWNENTTVWLAIVGKAGLGKTPSISQVIFPLMKVNTNEIKQYLKQRDKYEYYKSLDKEQQAQNEEIKKPIKTQFIANDITLEALVDLHEESDNAIGVFKDELAGWFKDMNKYRAGSDLEFWLSAWSGKAVSLNRKTSKSSFVELPLIPVLGGIQPSIFSLFYTEENKDNGFIDRMLLSFPDLEIEEYNEREIEMHIIQWYEDAIIAFYESCKKNLIRRGNENEIIPYVIEMKPEAKEEWIRIFNDITKTQNDHSENEYMKSMLPKQKAYIPRFALLLNTLNAFFNDQPDTLQQVTKDSILKAEKLSKYFIAMAKKVKIDSIEKHEIKTVVDNNSGKTNKEKVILIYQSNPDLNKKEISEMLGISRQTVYNIIKEYEKTKQSSK